MAVRTVSTVGRATKADAALQRCRIARRHAEIRDEPVGRLRATRDCRRDVVDLAALRHRGCISRRLATRS